MREREREERQRVTDTYRLGRADSFPSAAGLGVCPGASHSAPSGLGPPDVFVSDVLGTKLATVGLNFPASAFALEASLLSSKRENHEVYNMLDTVVWGQEWEKERKKERERGRERE